MIIHIYSRISCNGSVVIIVVMMRATEEESLCSAENLINLLRRLHESELLGILVHCTHHVIFPRKSMNLVPSRIYLVTHYVKIVFLLSSNQEWMPRWNHKHHSFSQLRTKPLISTTSLYPGDVGESEDEVEFIELERLIKRGLVESAILVGDVGTGSQKIEGTTRLGAKGPKPFLNLAQCFHFLPCYLEYGSL
ncbi:hypothetical protein Ahy_B06g079955 isoform A [Arachis hypogaea]|uniref:Uncharacterized protein n=1 Tax=Arachis hypogaea TaxID=3818 RepID=A0A444YGU0_ARAHY|nr:hypothetical protein Ahy_B06g079955 isoform A [Arachis hypogaea]